jgi:acyl-CoA synthetase (AMP-forming)/AMP-acid ligase II
MPGRVAPGAGETWSGLLSDRPMPAPAVRTGDVRWSTGDLLAAAGALSGWLRELDAGALVPAALTASPAALALAVAAAAAGTPLAPLNPRATAEETGGVLAAMGARTLVVDGGPPESADTWATALPGIEVQPLPAVVPADGGPRPSGRPAPDDLALLLHTSGTTGRPKPVPVRQDTLARRVRLLAGMQDIGPGSVVTTASPFHHIAGAGQLLVALGAGAAVVPASRFSVAGWSEMAQLGVTHTLLVPTMLRDLLDAGALTGSRLKVLQYGAAPMSIGLLRRVLEQLPDVRVVQLYGQTEGSPLTWLPDDAHRHALATGDDAALATVGVPVAGVRLWLDDPDAAGRGEVMATGGHLFGVPPGEPLRTGDLGRFDDAGRLTLVGRLGDRIIRGGENVDPVEVEMALDAHPAVRESAVVGVPDERLGERVRAFVVLADDATPAWDDLRAWARARLSGFKVPDEWRAVDALPRNPSGKILRRLLREQPAR